MYTRSSQFVSELSAGLFTKGCLHRGNHVRAIGDVGVHDNLRLALDSVKKTSVESVLSVFTNIFYPIFWDNKLIWRFHEVSAITAQRDFKDSTGVSRVSHRKQI